MNAQKISHRLLSALVAVCLLLTFSLPSAAAQENAPAVTVSSTSGVPGEQVEISMDTENLSPAIGLSIKFSFDSSQISCVDVKLDPGLEAEGKDVILLHSPNTGLITFAFVASDKVPYSFGHLFTATFEIKDGAQTTSITPKVEVYRNQSNEELSSSVKVSSGEITVMDIPVADISLDRHELNMLTGGTDTLIATVSPDNATDKSVSWASSDPGVVSVDQEGNLSALKPGNATITATAANGLSDSCSVTVADPDIPVADISLDRHELNMLTGGIDTLVATVSPDNATDKSVSWASSDPGVVSVDQEGNLSALRPGNATITATAANGLSDSCSVTVADPDIPVADISLDRHELNLLTGGTDTLIATITPDDATEEILWTSSDESIVTVDQNGNLKAVAPGKATVTAGTASGISDSCLITVTDPELSDVPVESVAVDPDKTTVKVGECKQLNVTISPENASDQTVTWTSSDQSIVTVDENGKITGVKPGTAAITVTTANGLTATCTVTVTAAGSNPDDKPGGSTGEDGGNGPQTGDSTSSSALLAGTIALGVSIAVLKKRRSA